MSRAFFLALLTSGMSQYSAARAGGCRPCRAAARNPPGRLARPGPSRTSAKKENPLEVVERIIKNSNAVGDKLAKTDTGRETLGKQETILKDIESLIDQQEDPPPPKPDQNQDKNKDDKNKDKKPDDMNDKDDMMRRGRQERQTGHAANAEGQGHGRQGRHGRHGRR